MRVTVVPNRKRFQLLSRWSPLRVIAPARGWDHRSPPLCSTGARFDHFIYPACAVTDFTKAFEFMAIYAADGYCRPWRFTPPFVPPDQGDIVTEGGSARQHPLCRERGSSIRAAHNPLRRCGTCVWSGARRFDLSRRYATHTV